jgi:hypothetical protein
LLPACHSYKSAGARAAGRPDPNLATRDKFGFILKPNHITVVTARLKAAKAEADEANTCPGWKNYCTFNPEVIIYPYNFRKRSKNCGNPDFAPRPWQVDR